MHSLGPRPSSHRNFEAVGIGLRSEEGQSEDAILANFLGFSVLGSRIEPSICKTFIAGSIPAVASDTHRSGQGMRLVQTLSSSTRQPNDLCSRDVGLLSKAQALGASY